MKKIISLLLTVALVATLTTSVFATEPVNDIDESADLVECVEEVLEDTNLTKKQEKEALKEAEILDECGLSELNITDVNSVDGDLVYTVENENVPESEIVVDNYKNGDLTLDISSEGLDNTITLDDDGSVFVDGQKVEYSEKNVYNEEELEEENLVEQDYQEENTNFEPSQNNEEKIEPESNVDNKEKETVCDDLDSISPSGYVTAYSTTKNPCPGMTWKYSKTYKVANINTRKAIKSLTATALGIIISCVPGLAPLGVAITFAGAFKTAIGGFATSSHVSSITKVYNPTGNKLISKTTSRSRGYVYTVKKYIARRCDITLYAHANYKHKCCKKSEWEGTIVQ